MEPRGRAFLKPATYTPSPEVPSDEYPLLLTTGRTVYHFHTRTKTARAPEQARSPAAQRCCPPGRPASGRPS